MHRIITNHVYANSARFAYI